MERDARANDIGRLIYVTPQVTQARVFPGDGKEIDESRAGMFDAVHQVTEGNNTQTPGAKSSRVVDLKEEGQTP